MAKNNYFHFMCNVLHDVYLERTRSHSLFVLQVPVTEAMGLCKNEWMREALVKFTDCLEGGDTLSSSPVSGDDSASDSLSHVSDEQPSEQPQIVVTGWPF
ncbi:hypothetical protein SUGI_1049240 [Cryptomeria japonica]|nr:hypothetical protein SUGI_1049240 [Cryptomeria japonica]